MAKSKTTNRKKSNYILTKNTHEVAKIKTKIESYLRTNLVMKVADRHGVFRVKTKSLFFTWIWGKLQSGKTKTIDALCQEIDRRFNENIIATTTLDDIMLNEQLKEDLKKNAIVLKLNEIYKLSENELIAKMQGANMLIIDEGDYGMGSDGRVAKLINNLIRRCKIHVVYVGATNYTGLLSELSTPQSEIDIAHFGLKVNDGYFGLQEFTKNKNIIDIKSGNYTIDNVTGNVSKPIRDLIISQNDKQSGLNIIRISARSKKDKTSITLANKVKDCLSKDARFSDYKLILMYDTSVAGRKLKEEFDTAQRLAYKGEKVIVLVVAGLRAGIAIWPELKQMDKLRFCYETSKVASSGAQGLPGRFCGYYTKTPTPIILCDVVNIDYYNEIHTMIDDYGYLELPETKFTNGRQPSTHIPQSERMVRTPIKAKLVYKGDWNLMDDEYKNKNNHTLRQYNQFGENGKKIYLKQFNEWNKQWQYGHEINVNEFTTGEIYDRDEYKPYYIMDMNGAYSTKRPVMVFELNSTEVVKELTRKVSIRLKDGYSPILNNG